MTSSTTSSSSHPVSEFQIINISEDNTGLTPPYPHTHPHSQTHSSRPHTSNQRQSQQSHNHQGTHTGSPTSPSLLVGGVRSFRPASTDELPLPATATYGFHHRSQQQQQQQQQRGMVVDGEMDGMETMPGGLVVRKEGERDVSNSSPIMTTISGGSSKTRKVSSQIPVPATTASGMGVGSSPRYGMGVAVSPSSQGPPPVSPPPTQHHPHLSHHHQRTSAIPTTPSGSSPTHTTNSQPRTSSRLHISTRLPNVSVSPRTPTSQYTDPIPSSPSPLGNPNLHQLERMRQTYLLGKHRHDYAITGPKADLPIPKKTRSFVKPTTRWAECRCKLKASGGVPIIHHLTANLLSTYMRVNPDFSYQPTHNPRRVLTKPSKAVHNNGRDNEDWDYLLYVNDIVGSQEGRQYRILDVLGQGTFGQVAKCVNIKTKELVAVKIIKNKPAYHNQSLMEVAILELLNHTMDPKDTHHLVRMKDHFIHHSHLCIVFEMLSVNLYELIKQNQFRGLSTNLVRIFVKQILDALCLLSRARILHCDLKPENILLKNLESPSIKVIDFGSACHENQTVYTYIQSRFYRSPEVLLGLPYTSSIDVWSLGCIAAELFLGLPLFPGSSEYNQISRIVEMLGVPPTYMCEKGKQAKLFFEKLAGPGGKVKYVMKTVEAYMKQSGNVEQPSKRYFTGNTLAEVINGYPRPRKNATPHEIAKETRSRECFINFLQGLLALNPFERWTPHQARLHPFVTGEEYTGPFVPTNVPVGAGQTTTTTSTTTTTTTTATSGGSTAGTAMASTGVTPVAASEEEPKVRRPRANTISGLQATMMPPQLQRLAAMRGISETTTHARPTTVGEQETSGDDTAAGLGASEFGGQTQPPQDGSQTRGDFEEESRSPEMGVSDVGPENAGGDVGRDAQARMTPMTPTTPVAMDVDVDDGTGPVRTRSSSPDTHSRSASDGQYVSARQSTVSSPSVRSIGSHLTAHGEDRTDSRGASCVSVRLTPKSSPAPSRLSPMVCGGEEGEGGVVAVARTRSGQGDGVGAVEGDEGSYARNGLRPQVQEQVRPRDVHSHSYLPIPGAYHDLAVYHPSDTQPQPPQPHVHDAAEMYRIATEYGPETLVSSAAGGSGSGGGGYGHTQPLQHPKPPPAVHPQHPQPAQQHPPSQQPTLNELSLPPGFPLRKARSQMIDPQQLHGTSPPDYTYGSSPYHSTSNYFPLGLLARSSTHGLTRSQSLALSEALMMGASSGILPRRGETGERSALPSRRPSGVGSEWDLWDLERGKGSRRASVVSVNPNQNPNALNASLSQMSVGSGLGMGVEEKRSSIYGYMGSSAISGGGGSEGSLMNFGVASGGASEDRRRASLVAIQMGVPPAPTQRGQSDLEPTLSMSGSGYLSSSSVGVPDYGRMPGGYVSTSGSPNWDRDGTASEGRLRGESETMGLPLYKDTGSSQGLGVMGDTLGNTKSRQGGSLGASATSPRTSMTGLSLSGLSPLAAATNALKSVLFERGGSSSHNGSIQQQQQQQQQQQTQQRVTSPLIQQHSAGDVWPSTSATSPRHAHQKLVQRNSYSGVSGQYGHGNYQSPLRTSEDHSSLSQSPSGGAGIGGTSGSGRYSYSAYLPSSSAFGQSLQPPPAVGNVHHVPQSVAQYGYLPPPPPPPPPLPPSSPSSTALLSGVSFSTSDAPLNMNMTVPSQQHLYSYPMHLHPNTTTTPATADFGDLSPTGSPATDMYRRAKSLSWGSLSPTSAQSYNHGLNVPANTTTTTTTMTGQAHTTMGHYGLHSPTSHGQPTRLGPMNTSITSNNSGSSSTTLQPNRGGVRDPYERRSFDASRGSGLLSVDGADGHSSTGGGKKRGSWLRRRRESGEDEQV